MDSQSDYCEEFNIFFPYKELCKGSTHEQGPRKRASLLKITDVTVHNELRTRREETLGGTPLVISLAVHCKSQH